MDVPVSGKPSPTGVRGGRVVLDQWTARPHVARLQKPVRPCKMRSCGIRAVSQESLWVGEIIIVFVQLRDGDAGESDVTLAEH